MQYTAEFASGYRAVLEVCMDGFECVWTPGIPRLSGAQAEQFMGAYRNWRNECLKDFALAHGLVLMDTPGYPDLIVMGKAPVSSTPGKHRVDQ